MMRAKAFLGFLASSKILLCKQIFPLFEKFEKSADFLFGA